MTRHDHSARTILFSPDCSVGTSVTSSSRSAKKSVASPGQDEPFSSDRSVGSILSSPNRLAKSRAPYLQEPPVAFGHSTGSSLFLPPLRLGSLFSPSRSGFPLGLGILFLPTALAEKSFFLPAARASRSGWEAFFSRLLGLGRATQLGLSAFALDRSGCGDGREEEMSSQFPLLSSLCPYATYAALSSVDSTVVVACPSTRGSTLIRSSMDGGDTRSAVHMGRFLSRRLYDHPSWASHL